MRPIYITMIILLLIPGAYAGISFGINNNNSGTSVNLNPGTSISSGGKDGGEYH